MVSVRPARMKSSESSCRLVWPRNWFYPTGYGKPVKPSLGEGDIGFSGQRERRPCGERRGRLPGGNPRRQRTWNIMSTWASARVCTFKHPRLLGEDVEVEADAVPGDEGVAVFDLVCQITDQGRSSSGSSCPPDGDGRRRATLRLRCVAKECRRAGNSQRTTGSPVPFGQFRRLDVESQVLRVVSITRKRVTGRQNRPPTSYIFHAVLP